MTLSEAQLAAVRRYTGPDYVVINGDCRGDDSGDPTVWAAIHHMDVVVAQAKITEALVLYRGVDEEYARELERRSLRPGDLIVDQAFLSTSTKQECARPFMRRGDGLMLKIHIPAGGIAMDLSPYSTNPEEYEFLLPRGTRLRVVGYDADSDALELEAAYDD